MRVFYNEWDKNASQWLRNLILAGQLPEGEVNDQDIKQLTGQSISGAIQAHYIRQRLYWLAHRTGGRRSDNGMAHDIDKSIKKQQEPDTNERAELSDGISRCGLDMRISNPVRFERKRKVSPAEQTGGSATNRSGGQNDQQKHTWGGIAIWRDGTARRFEPGILPLAHGVPGRVGQIRGYGNAIVPPLAAEFIKAFMEII